MAREHQALDDLRAFVPLRQIFLDVEENSKFDKLLRSSDRTREERNILDKSKFDDE